MPCRHWSVSLNPGLNLPVSLNPGQSCAVCHSTSYSICLWCGEPHCQQHHKGHSRLSRHHLSILAESGIVWCGRCGAQLEEEENKFEERTKNLLKSFRATINNVKTDPNKTEGTLSLTRGLVNLGNTCFMNAVLQCLCHIITDSDHFDDQNDTQSLLHSLFNTLKSAGRGPVNPSTLFYHLSSLNSELRRHCQQDAHDLLCKLVEACGEEFVDRLFRVELEWRVKCEECKTVTLTVERTFFLSVPLYDSTVDDPDEDIIMKMERLRVNNKKLSISGLLSRLFNYSTLLSKDNQYQCEKCGKLRNATQSMAIHPKCPPPPHLILHLQRYTAGRLKDTRQIYCDQVIRLPFQNRLVEYRLSAAVVHQGGSSLESGHYVALLCDTDDGVMVCSDASVRRGRIEDLQDSYILFYTLVLV